MQIFLLTLAVFAMAMGAMAIGVMLTGRRLRGSCGGASSDGGSCPCDERKRLACARKAKPRSTASDTRSLEVLPE